MATLIRMKEVAKKVGLSKTYIYALVNKNQFPKSVPLIDGGVSVAWVSEEIDDWIQERINARNAKGLGA